MREKRSSRTDFCIGRAASLKSAALVGCCLRGSVPGWIPSRSVFILTGRLGSLCLPTLVTVRRAGDERIKKPGRVADSAGHPRKASKSRNPSGANEELDLSFKVVAAPDAAIFIKLLERPQPCSSASPSETTPESSRAAGARKNKNSGTIFCNQNPAAVESGPSSGDEQTAPKRSPVPC